MPGRLLLVKHARPEIREDVPPPEWHLSAAGRAQCDGLAAALAAQDVTRVVSSVEPKAVETGRLVAERLGVPFATGADLHEHVRRSAPFFATQGEFEDAVRAALRRPGEVVLGEESGDQALDRFTAAIERELAAAPPPGALAVVSHGTVIALYVAARTGVAAVDVWESLGFAAVLECPTPC